MSKKHWLSSVLENYSILNTTHLYHHEHDAEKLESAILDNLRAKLPEEKEYGYYAELYEGQARDANNKVDGWNECLKAVKQALLGEK